MVNSCTGPSISPKFNLDLSFITNPQKSKKKASTDRADKSKELSKDRDLPGPKSPQKPQSPKNATGPKLRNFSKRDRSQSQKVNSMTVKIPTIYSPKSTPHLSHDIIPGESKRWEETIDKLAPETLTTFMEGVTHFTRQVFLSMPPKNQKKWLRWFVSQEEHAPNDNIKIQLIQSYFAKQLDSKTITRYYANLQSSDLITKFSSLESPEKRTFFLERLNTSQYLVLADLCTNDELDSIISSIKEDPNKKKELSPFQQIENIFNSLSPERQIHYLGSLADQTLPEVTSPKTLFSPNKIYLIKYYTNLQKSELIAKFSSLNSPENRIIFIQTLNMLQHLVLAYLYTNDELDHIISSIKEKPNRKKGISPFHQSEKFFKSLSFERQKQYLAPLADSKHSEFISTAKSCSQAKLNLAFSRIWLKNPQLLAKAVYHTNLLHLEGTVGSQYKLGRYTRQRCEQLSYLDWAAILPVLSLAHIKTFRNSYLLDNHIELFIYGYMDPVSFDNLRIDKKIHPDIEKDPDRMDKITMNLHLKESFKNLLKPVTHRLKQLELQVSRMEFEQKTSKSEILREIKSFKKSVADLSDLNTPKEVISPKKTPKKRKSISGSKET